LERSHQRRIAELKKFFREGYWVNYFTTNYLALRDRAYLLQNKLNPMLDELDPATKAWLEQQRQAIRNSSNPESTAGPALNRVKAAEESHRVVTDSGGGSGGRMDLGGGYTYDPRTGTVYDSQGNAVRSDRRGRGEHSSHGGRPQPAGFPAPPIGGLHEQANVGEQDHVLQCSDGGMQSAIEAQGAHLGVVDPTQTGQLIGQIRRQAA